MEINEITSEANADEYISEIISGIKVGDSLLQKLEDNVDEWTEEFESINREVKVRNSEDVNHYKLNMVIGLYFLIPVALFYIKNWKDIRVDEDVPVSNVHPDDLSQDLWNEDDKDDYFPSEPE